jgi:hypothetical protein
MVSAGIVLTFGSRYENPWRNELVVNGKEVIAKFTRRYSDCRKELQAWIRVCEGACGI